MLLQEVFRLSLENPLEYPISPPKCGYLVISSMKYEYEINWIQLPFPLSAYQRVFVFFASPGLEYWYA